MTFSFLASSRALVSSSIKVLMSVLVSVPLEINATATTGASISKNISTQPGINKC